MNDIPTNELQPLFPFWEARKGNLSFKKKNFDRHYLKVSQRIPESESLLYAMPASFPNHVGGAVQGCIALTEKRLIFSGGGALFSATGGEDIFDREYKDIEGFTISEHENPHCYALIIRRTKAFQGINTKTFDFFHFAYAFGEDAVKFTENAKILRERYLNK